MLRGGVGCFLFLFRVDNTFNGDFAMKKKQHRNHNEWFRQVSLGNRKSCPCCKAKLAENESIWSWGEYVSGKWRTVKYFCRNCFEAEVASLLVSHADDCGCLITLVGYHCTLPDWLGLDSKMYLVPSCTNN